MDYFSAFPDRYVKVAGSDEYHLMNNIFKHVTVPKITKTNKTMYVDFELIDGDTPDKVSLKLYGTSAYWWVILLFNDIKIITEDWPLPQEAVNSMVAELHDDPDEAQYYINPSNIIVQLDSYRYKLNQHDLSDDRIIADNKLTAISHIQHHTNKNNNKRLLKAVLPEFIYLFDEELEKLSEELNEQ